MRLYFDANAIIQVVEKSSLDADAFEELLQRAAVSGRHSVTSELSLAELLVHPIRDQDLPLISAYSSLLSGGSGSELETVPVSLEVLTAAAKLRARRPSIKLPDAIHVATAEHTGCTHIISGDKRLSGSTPLPLIDPSGADLLALIELLP